MRELTWRKATRLSENWLRVNRSATAVLALVLVINLIVALAKVIAGQITGTVSVMAEGFESLMDIPSEAMGLVALRMVSSPADSEHPYGHRKAETLATFVIAALMFLAVGKVFYDVALSFSGRIRPDVSWIAVGAMLLSLVTKIGLSTWEGRRGRRLGSSFLQADSAQLRVDVYRNLAVLAGLGAVTLGLRWADPILGVAIAGLILWTAIKIVRSGATVLLDSAAVDAKAIAAAVMRVPGVRECHEVRSRGHASEVFADLHVLVDPELSVNDGHDISERVAQAVRQDFPQVKEVLVHLEPYTELESRGSYDGG